MSTHTSHARPVASAGAAVRAPGTAWSRRSVASVAVLVLMPKCPACVAAYLGLSGSLGSYFVWGASMVWPVVVLLCVVHVGVMAWRLPSSRSWGPTLSLAAAAGIALGARGTVYQGTAIPVALILVAAAVVWQRIAMRPRAAPTSREAVRRESCCEQAVGRESARNGDAA